ncbi:MAG TPA: hypothetical protein VM778_03705 [Gemmatimonadota bacterium]|nr:hypothetical protein [Gemmatimonadota bacterium]
MLATLVALSSAQRCHDPPPAEETVSEPRPIEEVLASHTPGWMEIPGVVGTGQGLCDGTPCIVIYASSPTPEIAARIPAEVEGHPVRVEVTGRIEPLTPEDPAP